MEESRQIKGLLIGGGVFLAVLLGIGILINFSQKSAAQAGSSFQQKQLEMMNEAMDMAREAQRAQREHMRQMQMEMEGAAAAGEGEFAGYTEGEYESE
jgi:hypothetical protein